MSNPALELVQPTGESPYTVFDAEVDAFLLRAKTLVVDNYNAHRDREKSKEIGPERVRVVWYCKVLGNWKAILSTTVARGLLYEVSHDGTKACTYIDVYRKVNNVKIPDEDK